MTVNRYIPLFSTQSGAVPTASVMFDAELAINIADGRLYTRSGSAILHLNNTADFVSSSEQTVQMLAGQDVQVGSLSTPLIDVTGSIRVSGSVTASIFTGSFKGDGSQITGIAASSLDIDNFGVDLTNNFIPSSSLMIISSASVDGRIRLTQLANSFAGTGLETSSGKLQIASTAAGPGLTGGSGLPLSINTASAHFLSGSRNAISFADTSGPAGIDFTYINGTGSAQLVNSSVTVNAAAGLYGGGSVNLGDSVNLNVGAGLGIIVNLNDVELDTGSAHFNDGVKKKLDAEGVVSGNIGRFATTASNVFTGTQVILDTTPSSNFNEGAVVIDGGVGIQQNLNVGGDLNVLGTFSVATASFTTINSNILDVGTNKIIVNTSSSLRFGGISVFDSGSGNRSGSLYWDSFKNQWIYETEVGSPYNSAILLMGPQNSSSLGNELGLTSGRIPVAVSTNNLNDSPLRVGGSSKIHADNGIIVTGSLEADLVDAPQINSDTITSITGSFTTIGIGTLLPQYPLDIRDLTGSYGIQALVGVNELDGLVVWDGTYQANHPLRALPGLPSLDSTLVSIVTQKPYSGVSDDEYYQFVNYLNLNNYTANDNENVFGFTNYINYSSSYSQSAAVYTNTNAFTNDAGYVSTAFTNYSVARTAGETSRTNLSIAVIGWSQVASSASINTSYALRAQADANLSGSINTHYQVYATTNVQSSGSIRNLYGLYTTTAGLTSGQIVNYVGINSLVGSVSGANNTLVLLGTNTIPSGNWAIYDSSSYNSYFRGTINASAFIGDGSQLVGVGSGDGFPYSGSAVITGSLTIVSGTLEGTASYAISASQAITASYALNAGRGVGFPFTGSAVITGSLLILDSGSTGGITASFFTGSFIGDGSQLTGIPTELTISGSTGSDVLSLLTDTLLITGSNGVTTTITDNIITIGIPCGSISSSQQIIELLPIGIVSSSVQFSTGSFTGSFNGYHTGSFTGSFYGPLNGTASYAISSSHAITASYALNAGRGVGFPFTGSAVITGSLLILDSGSNGGITASFFTGSFIGDGSQLTGIATSLNISGSTSGTDSLNLKTEALIFSGTNGLSAVVTNNTITYGLPTGIVSSSGQFSSGSFTGSFSGSFLGVISQSSQVGLNQISGSIFNSNYTTFTFPQNLTVDGRLTAQEFYTEFVSSSIIYESGSTKFGDSLDDVHSFTGSLNVLGTISGSIILPTGIISSSTQFPSGIVSSSSQVDITQTTGYTTFSASLANTDATQSAQLQSLQNQTGSYATTGSNTFAGNQTVQGNVSASGTISASAFSGNGSSLTGVTAAFVEYTNVLNKPTLVSQSVQIDHNGTTNYVGNQHIDHSIVNVTAGSGLSGGGAITSTVTLTVDTGSSHFITGSIGAVNLKGVFSASSQIDHDATTNFVSNKHIDHSLVSITGVDGLAGGGNLTNSRTLSLDTGSAHFVTGSRKTISSTNTIGATGINLTYNTATGIISGSLVTGSIGIGTTVINLGTVTSLLEGLTSLQATSITGSLSGSSTLATNVVGAANRVLYNNGTNTTTTSANLTFDGTNLTVGGQLNASTKSFMIPHRTWHGKKLVYGVSEGPEHSVFIRGKLEDTNIIYLPDEWEWLVDEDSITVQLTSIGHHQKLIVKTVTNKHIVVAHDGIFHKDIHCYYLVQATRKDVPRLETIVD